MDCCQPTISDLIFTMSCNFACQIALAMFVTGFFLRRERWYGWWYTRRASADLSIFLPHPTSLRKRGERLAVSSTMRWRTLILVIFSLLHPTARSWICFFELSNDITIGH